MLPQPCELAVFQLAVKKGLEAAAVLASCKSMRAVPDESRRRDTVVKMTCGVQSAEHADRAASAGVKAVRSKTCVRVIVASMPSLVSATGGSGDKVQVMLLRANRL